MQVFDFMKVFRGPWLILRSGSAYWSSEIAWSIFNGGIMVEFVTFRNKLTIRAKNAFIQSSEAIQSS